VAHDPSGGCGRSDGAVDAPPAPPVVQVPARQPAARRGLVTVLLLACVTAVAVRTTAVVTSGGLHGLAGVYDDGVYYAAAVALSFGRAPYRDFVLLHPPGVVLALLPFAWLGRLTSDSTGMAAARLAWIGLGTVNSSLVAFTARRFGLVAAGVAGVFYATWPRAVTTETTTVLEPLVSLFLLIALAAVVDSRVVDRPWLQILGGLALGLAPTVKIWAVAPALVVLGWGGLRHGRTVLLRMTSAAGVATLAVCGPFLARAPSDMLRMVVLDQLGRGRGRMDAALRLRTVAALDVLVGKVDGKPSSAGDALAALTVVAVVALAWRAHRPARLFVVLTAVALGVLLEAPSFFVHYAAFVVPTGALTVGAAAGQALGRRRAPPDAAADGSLHDPPRRNTRPARTALLVATVAACSTGLVGLGATSARLTVGRPFPQAALAPAVAAARCVTADSPEALIALDVLSRDLRRGCPLMVDVSGLTYDRAALPLRRDHTAVPRRLNARWQCALVSYLSSGEATMILRARADDFSPGTHRRVRRWAVLAAKDGFRVLAPRDSATVR
jgi:hypothetical protein